MARHGLSTFSGGIMENNELPVPYSKELVEKNDKLKEVIEQHTQSSSFWNAIAAKTTPESAVEYRDGPGGEQYEYVKEEYCIAELNRLFPGWSEEDCKVEYDSAVRNYRATGYIVVDWLMPDGTYRKRKVFGVGGQKVLPSTKDPTDPVQPDDAAKGADTDRFKRCCKKLGIGLDVYAQIITPSMRRELEDKVRYWEYLDDFMKIVNTITKRSVFKEMVKNLPDIDTTQRFRAIMDKYRSVLPENKYREIWNAFHKQTQKTVDNFIDTIEAKLIKITQTKQE